MNAWTHRKHEKKKELVVEAWRKRTCVCLEGEEWVWELETLDSLTKQGLYRERERERNEDECDWNGYVII